jgi:hypothetical protein
MRRRPIHLALTIAGATALLAPSYSFVCGEVSVGSWAYLFIRL